MEKLKVDQRWQAELEEQLASPSMSRVYAFAANRARMVCTATGTHDELLAKELVLDAIGDTYLGVVEWNPAKAPLAAHLFRVIGGRTARMLARCAEVTHVALDHLSPELDELASEALGVSRSICDALATQTLARTVLTSTRELARDDELVLRLLDALQAGATTREEVMRDEEMSANDYHNARRRLSRLLELLPDATRTAVAEVLAAPRGVS